MYFIALLLLFLLPTFISTEPLNLTDKTWKDMLCGQWMVEFYAPWCPSCQNLKPIWADFSKAMIPKEVKVAAVDINQYPSLSGRFGISVLPTIYYVRDGIFRQFNGERSLNGLKNYIELQEWQRTKPVSSYFAPDSIPMSIVGSIFDVSLLVKDAYTVLQEQYGWPAWLIYIVLALAVIVIGLILGFGVLMLIDYCLTGTSRDETNYIPDDSKDAEELDENDDQLLYNPTKLTTTTASKPAFLSSSTPQRGTNRSLPAVRIQDDEEFLNEVLTGDQDDDDDYDDDEDNAAESDENEQTNNGAVRRRQIKK